MSAHPRTPRIACGTCGRVRAAKPERGTNECADCRWLRRRTKTEPTDADALPPGRWVTRGLIKIRIPDPTPNQKEPAA